MRNEMLQESREGFSASATLVREFANSERSKHHLLLPRTLATDVTFWCTPVGLSWVRVLSESPRLWVPQLQHIRTTDLEKWSVCPECWAL